MSFMSHVRVKYEIGSQSMSHNLRIDVVGDLLDDANSNSLDKIRIELREGPEDLIRAEKC